MLLIVNADDFGCDPAINRGIIHAFWEGIVTSATLMVNQPHSQQAVELALQHPELGVGLHVNLTRGEPISPVEHIPGLLSEAGTFREPHGFYQQNIDKGEVETEITAQLEKLMNRGIYPTHMDTHHHLQYHPVVLEVLVELAIRHQLPVRHVDHDTRSLFQRENIPTPDFFVSSFFGEGASLENLAAVLSDLKTKNPKSTVEVMCHPGFINDFTAESSYRNPRQRELEILCSGEIKELIRHLNIQLTNYRKMYAAPER